MGILLFACGDVGQLRLEAVRQRLDAAVVDGTAIKVVNVAPGEQAGRPAACLLRGAVVQPQLARTTADVDAAPAQHHPPSCIERLMRLRTLRRYALGSHPNASRKSTCIAMLLGMIASPFFGAPSDAVLALE